jgi:hypothetical protein
MAALARRKFWQANYCFEQAESNMITNRQLFIMYFESFIAFGRSVWEVLSKEAKGSGKRRTVGKCLEQRTEWKALQDDRLVTFFQCTRDIMLHQGRDVTRAEHVVALEMGATVQFKANETETGGLEAAPVIPEPKPPEILNHSIRFLFTEGILKDTDALEKSREYLARTKRAIEVAEECGA